MVLRGRKQVAVALAAALVVGALAAVVALPAGPVPAAAAPNSSSNSSPPDVSTLYQESIAATHSWSVHYASASTQSKQTIVESGDAGPASGSQTVVMGNGLDHDHPHRRHHLCEGQRRRPRDARRARCVASGPNRKPLDRVLDRQRGVRAGRRRRALERHRGGAGVQGPALTRAVRARSTGQRSTQSRGHRHSVTTTDHVVLYVRASGSHVPVEEDSVEHQGSAHRGRARRLFQVGRDRAPARHRRRRSPSVRSARSDARRLRPAQARLRPWDPNHARATPVGQWARPPPGSSERTIAPPARRPPGE